MSGRVWWVAPVVVAAVAGGAFAAVAVPGLAGGATVPDRLVVHRSTAPPRTSHAPTPSTSTTPRPAVSPTATAPSVSPTTQVVTPDRPVVRESDDRNDTNGERSPDRKYDGSGARGG